MFQPDKIYIYCLPLLASTFSDNIFDIIGHLRVESTNKVRCVCANIIVSNGFFRNMHFFDKDVILLQTTELVLLLCFESKKENRIKYNTALRLFRSNNHAINKNKKSLNINNQNIISNSNINTNATKLQKEIYFNTNIHGSIHHKFIVY